MNPVLEIEFARSFPRGPTIIGHLRINLIPPCITVLFGLSGSGKTTVLRVLAGLDRPTSGYIRFGEEIWTDTKRGVFLPPQRRRVGLLFQEYALFPHLSVEGNLRFGLGHQSAAEQKRCVEGLLARFRLDGLANRFPHQLSGGQQQRAALARTLAARPRLLLMDEPLSALDAPTREAVRGELCGLLRSFRIPVVLVTHDRVEALALGDELAVMSDERIVQHGPVEEVFRHPANQTVARIVGVETVQPARVVHSAEGLTTVVIGDVHLTAITSDRASEDREVFVSIRAEDVILFKGDHMSGASPRNQFEGVVQSLTREGPMLRIKLDCGFPLAALLTRQACEELGLNEGDHVLVLVKAPNVHLIPRLPKQDVV